MATKSYYQRNRERVLAQVRAYRERNRALINQRAAAARARTKADGEKFAAFQAYHAEYRARHRTKIRAYAKGYRERFRELVNAKHRAYRKTPVGRELQNQKHYRRKQKLAAAKALGSHTRAEWLALLAKHGGRCARCEATEGITKDHIKALVKGGSNDISNIQPLCRSCNSRKRANE
jgi:5-methylcytosine-specific restriction endonuclease McrA